MPEIRTALQVLGLELPVIPRGSTVEEAKAALEQWKAGPLKRAYRAKALQLHPDRCSEDTTQSMAELNAARDELMTLDVRPVQPPPPTIRTVIRVYHWGGYDSATTGTASSIWPWP